MGLVLALPKLSVRPQYGDLRGFRHKVLWGVMTDTHHKKKDLCCCLTTEGLVGWGPINPSLGMTPTIKYYSTSYYSTS